MTKSWRSRSWPYKALDIWAAVIVLATLWQMLSKLSDYQWDVVVYWWAGHQFLAGQSPYGLIPNQPGYLHFVYPPLLAPLFIPLAHLNVAVSKLLWLVLKGAAFAWLVRRWRRMAGAMPDMVPPVFFFTFAFGSAVLVDFVAGNISVFEQLLLWLGFTALLARRPWVFVLFTVLAAQFKLVPIAFLGVLLFVEERPLWTPFVGGMALFAAVVALNPLLFPAQTHEFLTGVSSLNERGWGDPATLGVMQDLIDQLNGLGLGIPMQTAYALYGAAVIAFATYTFRWWRRQRAAGTLDSTVVILVAIALYALVVPRMKDYSYVALVPAAWYVLVRSRLTVAPLLIFAALIPRSLPQLKLWLPMVTQPYVYAPLIGAFVVWFELTKGELAPAPREST